MQETSYLNHEHEDDKKYIFDDGKTYFCDEESFPFSPDKPNRILMRNHRFECDIDEKPFIRQLAGNFISR